MSHFAVGILLTHDTQICQQYIFAAGVGVTVGRHAVIRMLFSTLYMYSYCCLCILIVRPCILIVVYVYLLLSTYS